MENIEIWKNIPGCENLYFASTFGRIKSINPLTLQRRKTNEAILKQKIVKCGYYNTWVKKDGKVKKVPVHRLVALAFIENPQNKPQVNHIDGNKLNNNYLNLEWATSRENIIHAFKTGLNGSGFKNKNFKIDEELAKKILLEYKPHIVSQESLSKKYNIGMKTITTLLFNKNFKEFREKIGFKHEKLGKNGSTLKFTLDKTKQIKWDYNNSSITILQLSNKWKTSISTIRRILYDNYIKNA